MLKLDDWQRQYEAFARSYYTATPPEHFSPRFFLHSKSFKQGAYKSSPVASFRRVPQATTIQSIVTMTEKTWIHPLARAIVRFFEGTFAAAKYSPSQAHQRIWKMFLCLYSWLTRREHLEGTWIPTSLRKNTNCQSIDYDPWKTCLDQFSALRNSIDRKDAYPYWKEIYCDWC